MLYSSPLMVVRTLFLSLSIFFVMMASGRASLSDEAGSSIIQISNLSKARKLLRNYLMGSSDNEAKRQLVDMQLGGLPALNLILDDILEVYNVEKPEVQERVSWALELLTRASLRTQDYELAGLDENSQRLRNDVMVKMQNLLERYEHSSNRRSKVLMIYNRLGLWSRADLWYLTARSATLAGLQEHHYPLTTIMPELTDEERTQVEEVLRRIRPQHLLQFTTLYQLGHMKENDYVILWRLFAKKYTEAFMATALGEDARGFSLSPIYRRDFEDERIMNYFNEVLKHLTFALDAKDPMVTSAYERAYHAALHSSRKDARKPVNILFFDLVNANEPNIFEITNIRKLASNSLQNGEFVLPKIQSQPEDPRPSGEIIHVDFRSKARCQLVHDKLGE